ncbi:unnamed protein product [Durusdinium trenchii]|uniref:Uncharacterized protein n=1 Tax=Durusdinium trenchii TaxID=1381693 RepID=A0ABP0IUR4_9DINO
MMRWILASLVLSLAKGLLQANEGKLVNRHRHHLNRLDLQRRQALRRMARSTTNSPEQMLLANEEKLRSLDGVYDSLQDQRSHERDSMMASLSSQAEEAEDAPFIRAARQKRHDLALLQQTQDELQHLGFRSSKATKRLQKEASFPARKVSGSLLQGSKRKTGIAVAQRSVVRLRSVQEQQKLIETARAETQMSLQQKLLQIASKAAGSLASLVK